MLNWIVTFLPILVLTPGWCLVTTTLFWMTRALNSGKKPLSLPFCLGLAFYPSVILTLVITAALDHITNFFTSILTASALLAIASIWALRQQLYFPLGVYRGPRKMPASLDRHTTRDAKLGCLLALWLSACLAFSVHEMLYTATFGWDVIWFWAREAQYFLAQETSGNEGTFRLGQHPAGAKYLLSYAGITSSLTKEHFFLYAPWTLQYFSLVLVSAGIVHHVYPSTHLALCCAVVISSSPLLSTHASIGGYPDLFFASASVTTIVAGLLALLTNSQPLKFLYFMLAVCIAYSAVFIKNSGFYLAALSLIPILGILAFLKFQKYQHHPEKYSGVLLLGSIFFLAIGAVYLYTSAKVGVEQLISADIPRTVGYIRYATVTSSSFGLTIILIVPSLLILGTMPSTREHKTTRLYLIATQLAFTIATPIIGIHDNVARFASPDNDTSLSRALITSSVVIGISFFVSCGLRLASKSNRHNELNSAVK